MCLSTSCGAICKYCRIISIQYVVEQVFRRAFVDIALRNVFIEYAVEAEGLVLYAPVLRDDTS